MQTSTLKVDRHGQTLNGALPPGEGRLLTPSVTSTLSIHAPGAKPSFPFCYIEHYLRNSFWGWNTFLENPQKVLLHGQNSGWGFPGGSDSKESAHSARDLDLIPVLRRSPGEGNSYPLQYSGLENSVDRGTCQRTPDSPWGHKELDTTERLSLSLSRMVVSLQCGLKCQVVPCMRPLTFGVPVILREESRAWCCKAKFRRLEQKTKPVSKPAIWERRRSRRMSVCIWAEAEGKIEELQIFCKAALKFLLEIPK